MAITKSDFDYISQLAHSEAAIVLEPGKEYLVETRLGPLAQREGFASLAAFIQQMRLEVRVNGIHHHAIDALTTNETLFFRDFHPFEALRRFILPGGAGAAGRGAAVDHLVGGLFHGPGAL